MSAHNTKPHLSFVIDLLSFIFCLPVSLQALSAQSPSTTDPVNASVNTPFKKSAVTELPSLNSTVVPFGSYYHRYAQWYCQGDRYQTIYLLNEDGDPTQAVLERFPPTGQTDQESLDDNNEGAVTGKDYYDGNLIGRTLFVPGNKFDRLGDSTLFLLKNDSVYHFSPRSQFASNLPLRIGFCGVDSAVPALPNSHPATLLQKTLESTSGNIGKQQLALTEIQTDSLDLVNVELGLYHIFLHIPENAQSLLTISLNGSRLVGRHVRVTREKSFKNPGTLFWSWYSQIEFTDSEFSSRSGVAKVFSLGKGSRVNIKRSKVNITGNTTAFDAYYGTQSVQLLLDEVDFTSHDSARVFASGDRPAACLRTNRELKVSNTRYRGDWQGAFQLANTDILRGSINNDFSQASGARCQDDGDNTGRIMFTDDISCPGIQ